MFNSTKNPTDIAPGRAPIVFSVFFALLSIAFLIWKVGIVAVNASSKELTQYQPITAVLVSVFIVGSLLFCGAIVDRISLVTTFSIAFVVQSAILALAAFNHWVLVAIAGKMVLEAIELLR